MPQPLESLRVPHPPCRRLRAFAFDPSLSQRFHTADINEVTIRIPWEDDLQQGPVDEYLEVVDVDPASGVWYQPINLNDLSLVAQDGLPPSEGNPYFHQQMVYAVARTTIQHFEEALGRRALWAPRRYRTDQGKWKEDFVRRLRIYPHGLREANAFYSPAKKALLFGYFSAQDNPCCEDSPDYVVFTCLSHDIIAHETAHALLDGIHRRFVEPSNADVLALHEAFADIVALFQHFSYPEVLKHQIAQTRGNLDQQNLLAQLAWQFGQALGQYGALRDALGKPNPKTKAWEPKEPDPSEFGRTFEPHARGALLVAAVFDAYLTIYKRRIADLLRIASGASGVLPAGELHPDLVNRLADEAAKTAQRVLHICIRALDYCPPVDVTFGDYLRALITADADMAPDDRLRYRLAFIEAFRRRGIYPWDVRSMSEESLLWDPPQESQAHSEFEVVLGGRFKSCKLVPSWGLKSDRQKIYDQCIEIQQRLHGWLSDCPGPEVKRVIGLELCHESPQSIYRSKRGAGNLPAFEVHSVRPAYRVGPEDQRITDLVVEITQRRRGYLKVDDQRAADEGSNDKRPDFIFRGGCTLLIDVERLTGKPDNPENCIRYCIGKGITSDIRLELQRRFVAESLGPSLRATYFGNLHRSQLSQRGDSELAEPFALLGRHFNSAEEV